MSPSLYAFSIFINILIALFPLTIALFVNIFCLRAVRELSTPGSHNGSIITSPLLYLYFFCSYPITLIITWFPIGFSLLLLYGENPDQHLLLPSSMNEQVLLFILYVVLMSLLILGFAIRAGEYHRYPPIGQSRYPTPPPRNPAVQNNLRIPTGMVV